MEKKSLHFEDHLIKVIEAKKLDSSFKVRSYHENLKIMEQKNIPQNSIEEVLNDFFSENLKDISKSTKKSITQIVYYKEDRLIILESKQAREVIWNREQLVKKYGWFFFVTKKFVPSGIAETKKRSKKKEKSKERILSKEEYQVNGFQFDLVQKKNMRPLYHTKEYNRYLQIIKLNNIITLPIKETLNDFFLQNNSVPEKEKNAIRKIIYYEEEKVIVVKSLIGDKMYENLENLVRKYGWYFYITGVPVGKSKISIAIDKIEKRYDTTYFENTSISKNLKNNEKIRLILYPIASRPNHNCLILGTGHLNILLDCGIEEKSLKDIDEYLENVNDLLQKDKHKQLILSKSENEHSNLEDIDKLREINSQDKEEIKKDDGNELQSNCSQTLTNDNMELVLNKENFEPKIDAVFLSHSHYDHVSGLLDFIKAHPDIPVLCSRITLDLYLLRDSDFLDQKQKDEIEQEEYRNVVKNVIYVENGDKIEFKEKDCFLSFFHAGHMPGALMMLVKVKDYRFLYTGDYTYYDITPFAGTKRFLDQISRPLDFLLIDGSSAYEEFGNPSQHFHSLILFLEQKAEYGNSSLIGADPSSLAISFMLKFWRHFRKKQLRHDYQKRPNIYVDMMVRKNIQVINHRYKYIYGPISRLIRDKANPFNSIKLRWFDHDDLDFLKKKNCIIISHPVDLNYGIIKKIFSRIAPNPHNLVYLAGGINEEPGYSLVNPPEDKKNEPPIVEFSESWKIPCRALLVNTFAPQIKIKLHGDKTQLTEMIKNLEPREICFFHESPRKLTEVADYVISLGVQKVSIPQEKKLIILN